MSYIPKIKDMLGCLFGDIHRPGDFSPLTKDHGVVSVTYFFDDRGNVSWINCSGRLRSGRYLSQARWSLHDRTFIQLHGIARELADAVTRAMSQRECETFGSTHAIHPDDSRERTET